MAIDIRPMTPEDIPAALRLWQACDGISLRDADSPPALVRYLARNPGCSFVAVAGGELVGTVLAGHDGRRGYLHHAAVAAGRRRHGIGRGLVDRSLAALRAEGIGKVHLFVAGGNAVGAEFWNRLGWRERPDLTLMSVVVGDSANA